MKRCGAGTSNGDINSLIGLFLSVEYSRRLHGKYFWTGFQIPTN